MAEAEIVGGPPAQAGSSSAAPTGARRTPGPSVRPALIVVGLALLVVLVFGIGAALTENVATTQPKSAAVRGTGLVAQPASAALHPIEILGTPPADILDALVLPKGTQTVSDTPWSGSTQYSGAMTFRLAASQAAVVTFFRAELRARGWSSAKVGPAHDEPRATEVLAQRASNDGWFWEAGVVVSPTTFTSTGSDVTRFRLDLFELPDAA